MKFFSIKKLVFLLNETIRISMMVNNNVKPSSVLFNFYFEFLRKDRFYENEYFPREREYNS